MFLQSEDLCIALANVVDAISVFATLWFRAALCNDSNNDVAICHNLFLVLIGAKDKPIRMWNPKCCTIPITVKCFLTYLLATGLRPGARMKIYQVNIVSSPTHCLCRAGTAQVFAKDTLVSFVGLYLSNVLLLSSWDTYDDHSLCFASQISA